MAVKKRVMESGWYSVVKQPFSRWFGSTGDRAEEEVVQLPVHLIEPSPYQPRAVFDDERIDELCQTIRTHGIIQPVVVRKNGERYELVAGERRLRAVKKLELETIPGIVGECSDSQAASMALIENLQREGLTAIEEATAYQQLIDLHGLTQESLAQRLGKGQSTIANKLRLLQLPQSVQEALLNKQLTERHARALLGLNSPELQNKVLREIIDKELNVKQTENRVQQLNNKRPKTKRKKRVGFSRDTRLALNTIRQSVDMVSKTGLEISTQEREHDQYIEFIIKVPK